MATKNPIVLALNCETLTFSLEINGQHVCDLTEEQFWALDEALCTERKGN